MRTPDIAKGPCALFGSHAPVLSVTSTNVSALTADRPRSPWSLVARRNLLV